MGLTLITGQSNSGKTGFVIRRAIEAASAGRTSHIVVPTVADARRMQDELAGKSLLGIRVSTFQALVDELWMLHGDGRRPVARSTRSALVRRIVGSQPDPSWSALSRAPGLQRFLERAVSVSSPRGRPGLSPSTPAMAGMVELAAEYQRELAQFGFVETSWIPVLLGEIAPRLEGPLALARFDNLSIQQTALLVGLSRENDVTVTLTWEESFAATRANDQVVAALGEVSSELINVAQDHRDDELGRVAEALFGPPIGLRGEGLVITGVAAGEEGENALVAGIVRRELDNGTPAERVAVVCRNAGRRYRALDKALEVEGVRAQADVRRSVTATRLGRALSALLSLVLGSGGRAEAASLLTGPFCDLDRALADALDRLWRENRVHDSDALIVDILATHTSLSLDVSRARDLVRIPIDKRAAKEWQTVLDGLLSAPSDMKIGAPVNASAAEDAAAHRVILEAIGEMAATDGHPFNAGDIAAVLPSLRLGLPAVETFGTVQIIDAESVGARRFDVVVLLDLTANGFPVSDREALEDEIQRLLGGSPASAAARSRGLFYSLVTRARKRLYLVRQGCDAEGEPISPSPALEELLDLYRERDADPDDAPQAPPEMIEALLGDAAGFAPVFGEGRREQRIAADSVELRIVERDTLTSEIALAQTRERQTFSATEVETYLRCPYRWFYERVLRPKQIDVEFDGRELGTRSHVYLAAFYLRLTTELGLGRVTEPVLAASLDLFDSVSLEQSASMAETTSLDEELGAARALALARQVVADDADMFPSAEAVEAEVTFATLAFAGERFNGRIDRIDMGSEAAFVTDYKASGTVYGCAKFESEGLIQAVLYAVAAEQHSSRPVAASVYRSLRARRCRGFWRADLLGTPPARCSEADGIDAQAYLNLVEQTEERVAVAIAGMKDGRVPRSPRANACMYCPVASLCREGAP